MFNRNGKRDRGVREVASNPFQFNFHLFFSDSNGKPNPQTDSSRNAVQKLSGAFVDLFEGDLNRVTDCLKEAM